MRLAKRIAASCDARWSTKTGDAPPFGRVDVNAVAQAVERCLKAGHGAATVAAKAEAVGKPRSSATGLVVRHLDTLAQEPPDVAADGTTDKTGNTTKPKRRIAGLN